MVKHFSVRLKAYSRGFHLITDEILSQIDDLPENGLLNAFIQHTSASLSINENADPSVRRDFERHINKMVPEDAPYYEHIFEGSDDMPAHIKSSLFGASVSIPIIDGKLVLGTWQGIYLGEHRNNGGNRHLVITIYS